MKTSRLFFALLLSLVSFDAAAAETIDIAICTVDPISDVVYNGMEQKLLTVISDTTGVELTQEDYTISLSATNGFKNISTVTVAFIGKGNYSGSTSCTYRILPCPIGSDEVSMYISKSVVYNTQVQKEAPVVSFASNLLMQGRDYELQYKGLEYTNVGIKSVDVVGKGNFEGAVIKTYNISQKAISDDFTLSMLDRVVYNAKEHKPMPTLNFGAVVLVKDTDYTLSYDSDVMNVGSKEVTVTGKGNYMETSSIKIGYSIIPVDISNATYSSLELEYTGATQQPDSFDLVFNATKLTVRKDYTVEYESMADYISKGTKKAMIRGVGNYEGTKDVFYTINVTLPVVELEDKYTYCSGDKSISVPYESVSGEAVAINVVFGEDAKKEGFVNLYGIRPEGGRSFDISLPYDFRPGEYPIEIAFVSGSGAQSPNYKTILSFEYADIIRQKFGDVVFVDNSGRDFVAYQWYHNGVKIDGATKQFYQDSEGLSGTYMVALILADGLEINSCEFAPKLAMKVEASPNPSKVSSSVEISLNGFNTAEELSVSVYSLDGMEIFRTRTVGADMILIPTPDHAGVYVVRVTDNEECNSILKIIVE